MARRRLMLLLAPLLFTTACTFMKEVKGTVALAKGTTVETANKIVMDLCNDGFAKTLTKKFPNFDPVKHPKKFGLVLQYRQWVGKGPKELRIVVVVKYSDELGNVDEIVRYGVSIVQKHIRANHPKAGAFFTTVNGKIALARGTKAETANKIVMDLWKDDFGKNLIKKFPNFDPIKHPTKFGLGFHYRQRKKDPKDSHLVIRVRYTGELGNVDEIVAYGVSIAQKHILANYPKAAP